MQRQRSLRLCLRVPILRLCAVRITPRASHWWKCISSITAIPWGLWTSLGRQVSRIAVGDRRPGTAGFVAGRRIRWGFYGPVDHDGIECSVFAIHSPNEAYGAMKDLTYGSVVKHLIHRT